MRWLFRADLDGVRRGLAATGPHDEELVKNYLERAYGKGNVHDLVGVSPGPKGLEEINQFLADVGSEVHEAQVKAGILSEEPIDQNYKAIQNRSVGSGD